MEKCIRLLNNYKYEEKKETSDSVNQEEVVSIQDKYRHESDTDRRNGTTCFNCKNKGH